MGKLCLIDTRIQRCDNDPHVANVDFTQLA